MNILSAENITKSYGERMLFNKASFYLQEGEKVGVIGINGTGKTTLLRMLTGQEEPDEGIVTCANYVIISYLPQHPVFEENDTVLNAIIRRYQSSGSGHKNEQEIMTQARAMLTRLGVGNFEARCGTLSGGERKRIALVAALISPADILLLDEPTNHLDNEMADWLEEQLKKFTGAVIMVTHDRYFLDSVAGRIVEIDKGNIYSYQTGYSGYLELKAEREEAALASFRKRQSVFRKELEWVKRGARARTTKQKARLERFEELSSTNAPVSNGRVEIGSVSARMGKTTIELSHISKSYGETMLIRDFSYIFLKNDRVGFIGPNGCGKTTLMKILTGRCEPDTGSVTIGQTVKIGYYAQEINEIEMPPEKRVIDYIRDVAEYVQTEDGSITASQMLEKFLFEGKEQYGLLGKLSGGEKRRLNLLKVLMGAPNILILDEPTNDLDIGTLMVLEDYLDDFQGIVITVSHDRYFLDRTVKRIFAFEDGGRLRQYEGGYTDFHTRKISEQAKTGGESSGTVRENEEADKRSSWKQHSVKLKFSYQEQRDYETIEGEIEQLEERIEDLEQKITASATDFIKLGELTAQKEKAQELLEAKIERWMYLEELKAKIEAQ